MSDQAQGPGWWVASDGKWYPPERHPDYVAPAPPQPMPPAGPPMGQQQPQVIVQKKRGCLWWIGLGVAALVVIGIIGAIASSSEDKAEPRRTVTTEPSDQPAGVPADEPADEPDAPLETVAQANARKSAEQYLDMSGFSRSGLIKQLEFEGFSTEDATYGVDAQNADWNQQAARSAETYMETSSFSRASLIRQLEFEGFTTSEAEYGATSVGL